MNAAKRGLINTTEITIIFTSRWEFVQNAKENHMYCKECNDKMKQRVKKYYIKKSGVISNA